MKRQASLAGGVLAGMVRIYQRFISPLFAPRCKYYPSCSAYALRAFEVHGAVKGMILATWRLLRCNPFSDGGVDHVPLRGQWHNPWTEPGSITAASYGLEASGEEEKVGK